MNSYTTEQVLDALRNVRYPGTGTDIVTSGIVTDDIQIKGRQISLTLHFPRVRDPFARSVVKAAETAILTFLDAKADVAGRVKATFREEPEQPEVENPLPMVSNTIAIFSGKGGVGKSTVTSNLAVALARQGYRVGLLDADIYGPSMPKMFHCEDARPVAEEVDGKDRIAPIVVTEGIKMLSIGFFVSPNQALLWRGTMASNALKQMLTEGHWGELDYLLIDMPPGTGDIALTLVQTLPLTGAIVVTTPQEVALVDAMKGINLFQTDPVNVPILGLVENMSWFTPAELPDNKYYIFGRDGGKRLAEQLHIPLLGQLPLVQSVCEAGDAGEPIAAQSDQVMSHYFAELATAVTERVQERLTMAPLRARIIVGSRAEVTLKTLFRFAPITLSHCSSSMRIRSPS